MRIFDEVKGQGSTEYLLLLGAILFIAIAAILAYSSYFNIPNNNTPVKVTLTITNIGPNPSTFIYEANNTTNGNEWIKSGSYGNQFFTLAVNRNRTFNLGEMLPGTTFTIEGGVGNPTSGSSQHKGIGQSGRWTLTIGDQTYSWVITGPFDYRKTPTGSVLRSFRITGGTGGGSPYNTTSDINEVRTNVS
ncbi:MAG: class III signal peptide-containing protein [Methanobacteriaceae archaeon]|jgi:uncharacterized protein (UPF0333 family)|nr:class III signal peptide-containing protein [Methanobacteriaceae archaeon]